MLIVHREAPREEVTRLTFDTQKDAMSEATKYPAPDFSTNVIPLF
jgi:hypothetical protein